MNKIFLLVLAILLAGAFLVSAEANDTQGLNGTLEDYPPLEITIHINEFEQNPESESEWVELFNNGTEAVNISGWKIYDGLSSPHLLYTFIDGTFIGSEEFPVVNVSDLNNGNEFVTLKDIHGRVVDQTPILADSHSDNRTWQRVPDGTGEFVFKLETKGITNVVPLVIENMSSQECAFDSENITLSSDIGGGVDKVWFSYTNNGTTKNISAENTIDSYYKATIISTEIAGGMNLTWRVWANDTIGNLYSGDEKSFYIRKATYLGVIPWPPNGLNNWFTMQPLFIIEADVENESVYYQWDSLSPLLYSGAFGLEDAPNNQNITGGIVDLHWWSNFEYCGNETEQSNIFYIDLIDPIIKNLLPGENETVYGDFRPEISAYIDEKYQSNSGIDKESLVFTFDGNTKNADINEADTIDALVTYTPNYDLGEGEHEVSIYIEDNAGRSSLKTWSFWINSNPAFSMDVNSPEETIYSERRVPFNVTLSDEVEKLEYTNWDDVRPRWRSLCTNCDEYGSTREKLKSVNEGWNNVTIKSTGEFGQIKQENITFFVDSKDPKISKIEPRRNDVINGSYFYVKYTEDNLKSVLLYWEGENNSGGKSFNCTSGKNQECVDSVNLSDYNGEWINYYFLVEDSINKVQSRTTKVLVDTSSPILTLGMPKNSTYERKVPFNISITEKVKLEYIDLNDDKARWKRLCSNCDEYGFERAKTKSFGRGEHNLMFRITDNAGNTDEKTISFMVDY